MTRVLLAWLALAAICAACGDITVGPDSKTVGAACSSNADCAQQCLLDSGHFPGGLCTTSCATDASCPGGSACVSEEGGICVVTCTSDADCLGFGRGFVCHAEDRGATGSVSFCRAP